MPTDIDFSRFTAAKNSFEGNPGLCDLFKFLAIETWKRLEFTYIKPYLRVYETTLTQNIAFTINAYCSQYPGLLIQVWESEDENASGNDLELVINFSNFGFNFYAPIQAKKIYRHNKYISMDHGNQIEKLIEYADRLNGYPLYLLYNYVERPPGVIAPNPELYGCTVVDALHLKDNYYNKRVKWKRNGSREPAWIIPDFGDLHPDHAFPWHELVCDTGTPGLLFQKVLRIADEQRRRRYRTDLLTAGALENSWRNYPGLIRKGSLSFAGWFQSKDKDVVRGKGDAFFIKEIGPDNETGRAFNPQTRIVVEL